MNAEDIAAYVIALLIVILWSATYAFAAGVWTKLVRFASKIGAFIVAEEAANQLINSVVNVNLIVEENGTVIVNQSVFE